ncbi:ribonuclease H family protein [uncultured Clostridium sp.]|uniref:ribonuclease H family protein n=1 Tax=uncultured Clostridium sp. TaxID=59620 RepID=UPI0025E67BB5|nr:ribonuclease H family protein [uncultured Clostridium sp.]
MAKKVYAIQYGFDSKNNEKIENKIVETWNECLSYVKGVKGAKYKSFENRIDAEKYLNEGKKMLKKSDENYPKDCLHAYVDGSYNISDERFAYGLVCVKDNIVVYIENGAEKDTSEKNIRQIAGELKGAVRAVEYAISIGEKKVVIFHDYEGIAHHATGAWARNEKSSIKYHNKMQDLMNKGIEVIFVKVDSHTGDLFNELVDEKCKEPLGIPSDKTISKYLSDNVIYVSDIHIKKNIGSLAPDKLNNILIYGDKSNLINSDNSQIKEEVMGTTDLKKDDEYLRYKELTELYKESPEEAKKKISKMLSKDKEKYILYLLKLN